MRISTFLLAALLLAPFLRVTPLHGESALIDVLHYRARISFDIPGQRITGDATLTVRNAARGSISEIPLDLVDMSITSVTISDTTVRYHYDQALLVIDLPRQLPPNDTIHIRIQYQGSPGNEGGPYPWGGCHWGEYTYFMGVGFTDPAVSMMRRWLPSNDIPSDKATFDVSFVVQEGLTVAGTGLLIEQSSAEGLSTWRWAESHPTAPYLFTYAIADYAIVEDEWEGIPMQYFVPRADSLRAVSYFSTVPDMMEAFTTHFGPYPFDKIGFCITPIGSMEHQTMISYAQQLFTGLPEAGMTAAHELSHMWWGDWVTCADFRDAWLNEGFAVFSEMLYEEYLGGSDAYVEAVRRASQTYRISDTRNEGIFPLFDFPRTPPSSNYPSTIYRKGGVVMAMLRDVMGDEAFFEGLRAYGHRHAYGNATSFGLQRVMEEYHGEALDWFFNQWVFEAGWPEYTLHRILDTDDAPFRIRLEQGQDLENYPLFRMPMDLIVINVSGDTLWKRIETGAEIRQDFIFHDITVAEVRSVVLDPRNIVLKRVSYRTLDVHRPPPARPDRSNLGAIYPNPFVPSRDGSIVIPVESGSRVHARISLSDLLGRRVAILHDGELPAGIHPVRYDASTLSSGIYAVTLLTSTGVAVRSFVVE
jgi:aminopeptidase N